MKFGSAFAQLGDEAKTVYSTLAFAREQSCSAAFFRGHDLSEWFRMLRESQDDPEFGNIVLGVFRIFKFFGYYCYDHLLPVFYERAIGIKYSELRARRDSFTLLSRGSVAIPLPISTALTAIAGPIGWLLATAIEDGLFRAVDDCLNMEEVELREEYDDRIRVIERQVHQVSSASSSDAVMAYQALRSDQIL